MDQSRKRPFWKNRLFLATVAVPTALSAIYFGLIASDIYISEARFVVRSPKSAAPTGISAILQGTGISRSEDDTYTVQDFMLSRDALRKLDERVGIAKAYRAKDIDFINRFPGIAWWDDSFEALHRYYHKRVTIEVDTASSISAIHAAAFTSKDAHRINAALLEMGEEFVNTLNERARQDMIRFATAEVAIAEKKAQGASLALSGYRSQKSVVDPERQSTMQLQGISKLQDELIATKTQLAQVRSFTPDSSQIRALQKRAESLQHEIDLEMAKVSGTGGGSLTTKAVEFERLSLERGFAEKQLTTALASLEQARNDAVRKQLYLERIVQPNLPDVAVEPRRIRNVFATLILGLIAWGILTLLISGAREHRD